VGGTEGGHGEWQNTVKNAKKGGSLAAPERVSNVNKTLMSVRNARGWKEEHLVNKKMGKLYRS